MVLLHLTGGNLNEFIKLFLTFHAFYICIQAANQNSDEIKMKGGSESSVKDNGAFIFYCSW